jgi:glycosyltransferase involved in cell wall biosynthesis
MYMSEVSYAELREIYKRCYAGLIALSYLHTTHNIPGKFIAYMQAGLPVLASVNENNDLRKLIDCNDVGFSCVNSSLGELRKIFTKMLKSDSRHHAMKLNARSLYLEKYTSEIAANAILEQLSEARKLN